MNPRRKHFVALNKVKKNAIGKLALSFLKKDLRRIIFI